MPRGWQPTVREDSPGAAIEAEAVVEEEAPRSSLLKRPLVNRTAAPSAPPPVARAPPQRYSYKWTSTASAPADQHGKTFGPFPGTELASWVAQGYFGGPEASSIVVQREGTGEWTTWPAATAPTV